MKDNKIYIAFILKSIKDIEAVLGDNPEKDFFNSLVIEKAVIRILHEITETTQRISDDLKQELQDIDWKSLSGFRNILVHDYLGDIDLNTVYKAATISIPDLKEKLEKYYLNKYGDLNV